MEELGRGLVVAFVLVGVLALVVLVLASKYQQIADQRQAFRQLSQRLGGRLYQGNMFDSIEVTFHHGGTWGRVDTYSTGGKNPVSHTRVRIAWPDARVRCEVFPGHVLHRLGKLLGMVDFEIGVPEFDHDYIISGENPERIRELLSAEVRGLLNQVRARAEQGDMYLSVMRGEMLLRRRGVCDREGELEQFVRTAIALFDVMSGGGEQGIKFIDEVRIEDAAATVTATCQICGEAISADPVLCNACRTPHHHDCWEYYGQCSTFGCRERGFHRPRRQAAAQGRK